MRVQAADRVVVHVGLVRLAAEEVELAQLVRGRVRVRVRVRVTGTAPATCRTTCS